MAGKDYSDSGEYSLPPSKEAVNAGVQWMRGDGVRTLEEAREIEKVFVDDAKRITPEDIRREQEKANRLRDELKDLGILEGL